MLFTISDFKGEMPRGARRALPPNYAQRAVNVRLEDGTLTSIRKPKTVHTFPSPMNSIYLNGSAWMGWESAANVVPAPVAANRIYLTGDGVPKMIEGGTEYGLALPGPINPPVVACTTTPDPAAIETVIFAYTFVTSFGEESQPSPLTAPLDWSQGVIVTVSGFGAPIPARGVSSMRIYRSQTSATGATALFFATEIALGTVSYDYDAAAEPLGEAIPSIDFDTPPDNLQGLIAMPNGMMAAFEGKDVYFCEPYQPHAWPERYVLTVDFTIIGLASFGSTLAILTIGTPYIAQGSHPDSMAMEKMESNLPCLSRRGIVDVGYAAIYPSSEGLVAISQTEARVVSRPLFTRDQWEALSPSSFVASGYNGRYMFTFTDGLFDTYDAGIIGEMVEWDTELDGGTPAGPPAGFVSMDFGAPDTAYGDVRVGTIDLSGEAPFFMSSDVSEPASMFSDPTNGRLYMLEGAEVKLWDAPSEPVADHVWRSKLISGSVPSDMGAFRVKTDTPMVSGDTISCTITASGKVIGIITEANKPKRLKGGRLAESWEIEVRGNVIVTSLALANTIEELLEQP
ncbi:hypothetical protein [Cereibacter changlensis]|uniref:hypothetical protein n=1 Tax=Cereibacter changlensis TaxID=402884 RepID=UPI00403414F3